MLLDESERHTPLVVMKHNVEVIMVQGKEGHVGLLCVCLVYLYVLCVLGVCAL